MSGTLRLRGSTSGYSELQAPAVAADQTFVLPTAGGTLITTDSPVPKLTLGLGSASEPSLTFQGDTDTGLFSEGTNTLNLVTGGSSKVVLGAAAHTIYAGTGATVRAIDIDSSGRVGVGTSSPSYLLDCKSTGATNVARFLTGSTVSSEVAQFGRSDQAVNLSIDYDGAGSMGIGTTTAHPFNLKTGAVTRATIDSSGNVGIGTTSPAITGLTIENASVSQGLELEASSGFAAGPTVRGYYRSGSAYKPLGLTGSSVIFGIQDVEKARIDSSGRLLVGTSTNSGNALLQVAGDSSSVNASGSIFLHSNYASASLGGGDGLGIISAGSNNGGVGGSIQFVADATWGSGDYPTRLVFSTTADGAGSATEKMRIDSSGNVGINTTGPAAKLDVNGNQTSNVVAMAALDVDCSAGNYFTKTINGNSTFTFSNVPSSRSFSFVLELTHTSGTVTWPASVKFPADTAPTLTTGKTHLFVFVTDDGGSRFRGAALVDYVN